VIGRRHFLKALSMTPFAGRMAAQEAAAALSGVTLGPGAGFLGGSVATAPAPASDRPFDTAAAWKAGLNSVLRDDLISSLYEQERRIGQIDPDIAACRSFSLAAKVTFQRQRNVAWLIAHETGGGLSAWSRMHELLRRAASPFGLI
jgi:hypothetical protein